MRSLGLWYYDVPYVDNCALIRYLNGDGTKANS